jgi:hypothetical protein
MAAEQKAPCMVISANEEAPGQTEDTLSLSVGDAVSARAGAGEYRMEVEAAGWPHRATRSAVRGLSCRGRRPGPSPRA